MTQMWAVLKGVIAMAWPRAFGRLGSDGRIVRDVDGNIALSDETVPPNRLLDSGQAMIHFDLDPYNGMSVYFLSCRCGIGWV